MHFCQIDYVTMENLRERFMDELGIVAPNNELLDGDN